MFLAWDQFAYQWQFLQLLNEERLKQQWISLHLGDIEGGGQSDRKLGIKSQRQAF